MAGLMAGIFINTGADAFNVHPAEGEVAIVWPVASKGIASDRLGRFQKWINTILNAMAMAIPPITPPEIAGAFNLCEDTKDDAKWEDEALETSVEVAESDVGVETINSGLPKENERWFGDIEVRMGDGVLYGDSWEGPRGERDS
jgi:hypothetical protein